jgi:16S rRNA processing protein RimM
MSSAAQWTLLARILRPQGRKGEVLADLFTDFPERFASRGSVWLASGGFAESTVERHEPEPAEVIAHWLPVGRNAGRIVLQFAGIDSISAAEQLAGKEVVVPAEARMPLEPGAAYISDLIGCTVYDGGEAVGTVEDVQFATTPDGTRRLEDAAPLLVVQAPDQSEILIPFVNEYLVELDSAGKAIRMALPEGLTKVNEPDAE